MDFCKRMMNRESAQEYVKGFNTTLTQVESYDDVTTWVTFKKDLLKF